MSCIEKNEYPPDTMTAQQLVDLVEMKLPEGDAKAIRTIDELIELLEQLKDQIESR